MILCLFLIHTYLFELILLIVNRKFVVSLFDSLLIFIDKFRSNTYESSVIWQLKAAENVNIIAQKRPKNVFVY